MVPDADAAVTAGKLLEDLPALWEQADLGERRRILLTMLDAVYVDTVEERRIVAIRPRPAFRPLFEIATTCLFSWPRNTICYFWPLGKFGCQTDMWTTTHRSLIGRATRRYEAA